MTELENLIKSIWIELDESNRAELDGWSLNDIAGDMIAFCDDLWDYESLDLQEIIVQTLKNMGVQDPYQHS